MLGVRGPRGGAGLWNGLGLALALLVARVLADDADHALATDNLALDADLLDGCSDLHRKLQNRVRVAGFVERRFIQHSKSDSNTYSLDSVNLRGG